MTHKSLISAGALFLFLLPAGLLGQATKKGPAKKAPPAQKKSSSAQSADRRLSLDQIRKLIVIRTPDSVIAQEIQSRGISGDYGRKEVDQIRQQGGGAETVAALLRAIPSATLVVRTEPGASVQVDGDLPLQAESDGAVTISNIDPGRHQLTIQKQFFTSATRPVELKGRESTSIEVKLDWAVGFLTVTTNVPDAQIQVSGGPAQRGRVSRMPVQIGQAAVLAMAPLRKTASQTVGIEPGKEATVVLSLALDEAALNARANQIHTSFRSHLYAAVIQQAGRYLQTGVRDKQVLGEVAISYLEMENYSAFQEAAPRALAAGATLQFEVMHHHLSLGGFGGGSLHPAELIVTADTLGFNPSDRCNVQQFQTPMKQGRLGSRQTALLNKERSVPVASLNVPDPSNPKKQVTLNISAGRSLAGLTAAQLRNPILFRDDSSKVDAIRQLLQTLTR